MLLVTDAGTTEAECGDAGPWDPSSGGLYHASDTPQNPAAQQEGPSLQPKNPPVGPAGGFLWVLALLPAGSEGERWAALRARPGAAVRGLPNGEEADRHSRAHQTQQGVRKCAMSSCRIILMLSSRTGEYTQCARATKLILALS